MSDDTSDLDTELEQETGDLILDALVAAAAAHGIHEAEALGGEHDVEWPSWYAEHMDRALGEAGYRLVRTIPRPPTLTHQP